MKIYENPSIVDPKVPSKREERERERKRERERRDGLRLSLFADAPI